jgi:hypothetical protein
MVYKTRDTKKWQLKLGAVEDTKIDANPRAHIPQTFLAK